MVKRADGRRLDAATQAHVRRTVVQAVRGGLTQTAAARLFGVSVRAVNQWMAATKQGGLRALKAKPRGRPVGTGSLTSAQATNVRQRIVDTMPDQLKLPCYLWTRAAVASLIARDGEVTVSLTTVGRSLAAWGFSVQQPMRRAYERNDAAIAKWLKREYPAIAGDAKREGATIYWGDEMGLRSDHVTGTSYAPVGQTPVGRATGQRVGCSMISALTNRGGSSSFGCFTGPSARRCSSTSCAGSGSKWAARSISLSTGIPCIARASRRTLSPPTLTISV